MRLDEQLARRVIIEWHESGQRSSLVELIELIEHALQEYGRAVAKAEGRGYGPEDHPAR